MEDSAVEVIIQEDVVGHLTQLENSGNAAILSDDIGLKKYYSP